MIYIWRMKYMDEITVNDIVIDEAKLNRIKIKIYHLERQNTLDNKFTKTQMVEEIKKIIEKEIDKCY